MGFLCVHLQIDVYTIDRINSRDVLQVVCRRLSVESVFLIKTIFPEGMGGVQNTRGNSGGVGGLSLWSKNGNSGVEGGSYVKLPPWWGYGYFLEPHNINL